MILKVSGILLLYVTIRWDDERIKHVLAQLTERVEERLVRRKLKGKTVQLMIRYNDRQTITRSRKSPQYIQAKEDIYPIVVQLLHEHWTKKPIRLLGVTVQDLLEAKYVVEQLDLFTYKERNKQLKVKETMQSLTKRYGEDTFITLSDTDTEANEKLYRTSFQKDFLDDYKEIKDE